MIWGALFQNTERLEPNVDFFLKFAYRYDKKSHCGLTKKHFHISDRLKSFMALLLNLKKMIKHNLKNYIQL